jgi:hypothetical protein
VCGLYRGKFSCNRWENRRYNMKSKQALKEQANDNGISIKEILKELKGNGRCPYAN